MALFGRSRTEMPTEAEALPGCEVRVVVPNEHIVKGTPMEPPFPAGLETSIFGLGCFWGAELPIQPMRKSVQVVLAIMRLSSSCSTPN